MPVPVLAPVDLAQLAAQTGNDRNLEREVLRLYLDHCPADLARLKAAALPDDRRKVAHLMAGSARAVGAGEVARLAALIEKRPDDGEAIAGLGRAVDAARRFIADHLASAAAS